MITSAIFCRDQSYPLSLLSIRQNLWVCLTPRATRVQHPLSRSHILLDLPLAEGIYCFEKDSQPKRFYIAQRIYDDECSSPSHLGVLLLGSHRNIYSVRILRDLQHRITTKVRSLLANLLFGPFSGFSIVVIQHRSKNKNSTHESLWGDVGRSKSSRCCV